MARSTLGGLGQRENPFSSKKGGLVGLRGKGTGVSNLGRHLQFQKGLVGRFGYYWDPFFTLVTKLIRFPEKVQFRKTWKKTLAFQHYVHLGEPLPPKAWKFLLIQEWVEIGPLVHFEVLWGKRKQRGSGPTEILGADMGSKNCRATFFSPGVQGFLTGG